MIRTWGEKMSLKKISVHLGFSSKIKVHQLGSARNLHSSARLEPENYSSGSSLQNMYNICALYKNCMICYLTKPTEIELSHQLEIASLAPNIQFMQTYI